MVRDEDAPVVGVLCVIQEFVQPATVLVESTSYVGVFVFETPPVVVGVLGELFELAVKVAILFLSVA